ncbi:MAG TPA: PQQ-binding-like beta-propeller repeat protein [Bryobacteraceae bacterium]|nr:PQQ-binding-like beta-propeller repeat protein [Bryobacteraceae bacterium]
MSWPADWLTFAHDPQRTGWAMEESGLNAKTVPDLTLLWKSKAENQSYSLSALTAPVVAEKVSTAKGVKTVVYVAGISGKVFAFDSETGELLWTYQIKNFVESKKNVYVFQGTFLCPNGITATPVIDKRTDILYVLGPDGMLYGLDLGSGRVRYGPIQFVAPFSKSWSLSLVDGRVYTTLSQGCGNGLSGFYSIDVRDPHRPVIEQGLLSNTNTAGIWGRGGPVIGTNDRVYGGTGDGSFNPIAGDYSNTVVAASLESLKVIDYYLPPNWSYLNRKDFDLGSASPVFFGWHNRYLLAHGAKEGVIYLMDADSLGSKDHQTTLYTSPRLGNDAAACCSGLGIWGGLSTARDADGQTWLYVPMGGPPAAGVPRFPMTSGDTGKGSIMAFRVVADPRTQNPTLEPAWISGGFASPEPVVIADDVVLALSNGENPVQKGGEKKRLLNTHPAVLKALDAKTGRELFNSGSSIESWVHFTGLAVANANVFLVDHDSNVYCFAPALKKTGVTTRQERQ